MLIKEQPAKRIRGQSLVEFTLAMPILIFVILVMVNSGRALFTYVQATNALREAARYAEVDGYAEATTRAYLDCAKMKEAEDQVYFAEAAYLAVVYQKASNTATYNCDINPPTDADLANGDMLQLSLSVTMEFIALPLGDFTMNFQIQRTLLKSVDLGYECPLEADPDDCDLDYDGLRDGWERQYFDYTSYFNATDDPDQDGCNNGCEEQHSINPESPDGDPLDPAKPYAESGEVSQVTAPLAPAGFTANVVCSTGKVSFNWQPLSPVPARAQIKDASTQATIVEIDNTAPGLLTQSYCNECDTIPITGTGYRRYYMVSYNGTAPMEVKGPSSNIAEVSCLQNAQTPLNFTATTTCNGRVDFSWQWNTTIPVRVQIFREDNDTLVSEVGITSNATTTCEGCDTWDVNTAFQRSYYLVAYNAANLAYPSAPSNVAAVSCASSTTLAGTIQGTLWLDINDSGGTKGREDSWLQTPSDVFINLRGLDSSISAVNLNIGTNASGQFIFENLQNGQYLLTVPAPFAGQYTLAGVAGDVTQAPLASNSLSLTILDNQAIQVSFRYLPTRGGQR